MTVRYFGQFLLEKGYITKDALIDGISHQKSINQKIGILALDKQFMTADQIKLVLDNQKKDDSPFGEIAIKRNYLTKEQLFELLSIQKTDRIFLGEALLEKKIITLEKLEEYLREYKREQRLADNAIYEAFSNLNNKHATLIKDSVRIILNMLTRLVDEKGKIAGCYGPLSNELSQEYITYQNIFGQRNIIIGMALNKDTLLFLSSKILKKTIIDIDEFAKDGLKEFLNIITGHVCSLLSSEGIKIETSPPQFKMCREYTPELASFSEVVVPIIMTDYRFTFHFFTN